MAGRPPPTSFLVGLGLNFVGVVVLAAWWKTGLFVADINDALPLLLAWPVGLALPFLAAGLIHDWDKGFTAP